MNVGRRQVKQKETKVGHECAKRKKKGAVDFETNTSKIQESWKYIRKIHHERHKERRPGTERDTRDREIHIGERL